MKKMYSSREPLIHHDVAVESMPQDALMDLYRLLHFVDDWEVSEDQVWGDIYHHPKVKPKEGTAKHRTRTSNRGNIA